MIIILKEEQYNKLKDLPRPLLRRMDSVDNILKEVLKMYDVSEYNRFDFIDEVLHSIYDELDFDDVNEFFEHIKPMYEDKIGKIYDYKVKRRQGRK
jgi:hypothetical protein